MKPERWMKGVVYSIVFSMLVPSVFAQPGIDNFVGVFGYVGQFLELLFQNEYAVFAIMVVAMTAMLYNIFVPLLAKIPVFKGGEAGGVANKYGKVVALCLSLLCSLGIFGLLYLNGGVDNVRDIVDNVLGPYSTLAGIVIALLIFSLVYFGFKDMSDSDRWKRGMWATGLSLVAVGGLMAKPFLHMLGWVIVFIMLLVTMFRGGPVGDSGGNGGSGSGKDKNKKKGKVRLEGKIVDKAGKPVSGKWVTAISSTGVEVGRARSLGNGDFTIEINDIEEDEVTVADVAEYSDRDWSAYYGAMHHDGAEPPYELRKGGKQKNIIVAPKEPGDPDRPDGDDAAPFEWRPVIKKGDSNPAEGVIEER